MSGNQWAGLLGLLTGLTLGGIGLWLGMRAAARRRGIDERFQLCKQQALADSWKVTGAGLVVAMAWALLAPIPPRLVAVLGALYLLHFAVASTLLLVRLQRT